MRFAVDCAVGAFVLGIVAADLGLVGSPLASRGVGLALLLAAFFCPGSLRTVLASAAAAWLGAAAMGGALERAREMAALPALGMIDGRVAERRPGAGRTAVVVDRISLVDRDSGVGRAKVAGAIELWARPGSLLAALPRGDAFRADVRTEAPKAARNPGGRDRARELARRGIGGVGGLRDDALVARTLAARPRFGFPVHGVRSRVSAGLRAEGQGGALLAALAVGDRSGLDPAHREAAARGGVAHLLAVSGLHLALVAGGTALLLGAALRRAPMLARFDARRLAWGGAVLAGAGYVALTGAPVSMQRAFVFLAVLGAAGSLRRPVSGPRRLVLAAGAVIWLEPAAVFAPGAQLSFAATLGLIVGSHARDPEGHGFRTWTGRLLRSCAAASLATAPIAALHFGTASPFGWIANGVAIPFTTFVLLPLALAAAAIEALACEWLAPFVTFAARVAAGSLEASAAWAQHMPPAGAARPGWLGVCLAAGVAAWGISRPELRFRGAAAVVCGAVLAWAPPAHVAPGVPRIVFLDVGWGDAVLVQGRSAAILVDGGGAFEGFDAGRATVLPALSVLGVRRLDAVVATHRDRDHVGGLPAVLGGIAVDALWLPFGGRSDEKLRAVVEAARTAVIPIHELGAGSPPIQRGDLRVEPLWPLAEGAGVDNAHSLVLRITLAGRSVLLTGDLEAEGERALLARRARLASDLLKLGHHGSRTSSREAFLLAVDPAWAVVSAPGGGRLAFPHRTVLDRVERLGIPLAWTGRDGAVLVGLDPLEIRGWRGRAPAAGRRP